ncbi:MAG: zinc-ribbon domain-containing protein, partial [Lachnospiraceae bacterium]|nr:zinc-ribbon domain-containing protein [Lachnospiraceae bacterium]
MFCKNCGIELPDNALFCSKCGQQQNPAPNLYKGPGTMDKESSSAAPGPMEPMQAPNNNGKAPKGGKKTILWIACGILLLAVIGAVGFFVLRGNSSTGEETASAEKEVQDQSTESMDISKGIASDIQSSLQEQEEMEISDQMGSEIGDSFISDRGLKDIVNNDIDGASDSGSNDSKDSAG